MTTDPEPRPAGSGRKPARKHGSGRQPPAPPPGAVREEEPDSPACEAPPAGGMDAIRLLQLFAIVIAALALAWLVLSSILHLI